ncbi:MAG TPA: ATP-dependent Clp protease proteolytic subunit [Candidatus Scalindua sp.]|nr:ATP-dependent Clp protease proteolytic subunit [Candidatus Scalindua sp.]
MKKTKVTNPLLRPGNIDVDRIVGSHEYLLYKRVYIMDHIIDRPDLGFIPKMLMLDSINHDPIKILIYSPGGSVDAGFAMCDVMGMIKSPIITVGIGLQSMATTVFMMGSPGKRFLFPHARVMLHLPYGMMRGDEKDMAIASKQMTIIKNEIIDLLIQQGIKRSKKQLLKDIDREHWLNAEESLSYGIGDSIITPKIYKEIFG